MQSDYPRNLIFLVVMTPQGVHNGPLEFCHRVCFREDAHSEGASCQPTFWVIFNYKDDFFRSFHNHRMCPNLTVFYSKM